MYQRQFTTRSATINVMTKAVMVAANRLVRDFNEVAHLQVSQKGPGDFVTAADKRSEKILYTELKKARPKYGFLMEESGEVDMEDAEGRWIIDPLDGTTNFIHGIPHFCLSVALEKNGEIIAGTVYDPIKDEMFWAEKGLGAYVNDQRLRVSARRDLESVLLSTGIPFKGCGDIEIMMQDLKMLAPQVAGIRRFGAAALDLAYVAAGRYDGYWERDVQSWDVAAGVLLVKEAGGFVSSADPKDQNPVHLADGIIAGNDTVFRHLRKTLIA